MSQRMFNTVLTLLIAGGLMLAILVASVTYVMQPNGWWFIGYFVVALPGVWLSAKSGDWLVSLVGYLMVIGATGAIVGPYTHLYAPALVLQVALITLCVSLGIGFAGAVYPKSVENWGGFLLTGLIILICGDVVRMFMASYYITPVTLHMWDWIAVVLFSAFIFYDMNRAQRMAWTLDNAVDSAVALYLDIINLFIRLLAARSGSSRSDSKW
ncbi:MAG: Bax inhibitor-1/YccA family protein [Minisyncoccota bacterium]